MQYNNIPEQRFTINFVILKVIPVIAIALIKNRFFKK